MAIAAKKRLPKMSILACLRVAPVCQRQLSFLIKTVET